MYTQPQIFQKSLAFVLVICVVCAPLYAREPAQPEAQAPQSEEQTAPQPPNPNLALNEEQEELDALDGLRRFEIVFFGTIPFTILFTTLGYSTGRYLYHGFTSGFDSTIAQTNEPDIFNPASFTTEERGGMLIAAVSISLTLAIIDIIIEAVRISEGR